MRCCRPYTKTPVRTLVEQAWAHRNAVDRCERRRQQGCGEHSAIWATRVVTGKKSAEGIVGVCFVFHRRPEHDVRRSAIEGRKCDEPDRGSIEIFLGLNRKAALNVNGVHPLILLLGFVPDSLYEPPGADPLAVGGVERGREKLPLIRLRDICFTCIP
ncbi:MAG: hypothetical protein ACE5GU_13105 [Candidatus Scalinduaceae bacterium]